MSAVRSIVLSVSILATCGALASAASPAATLTGPAPGFYRTNLSTPDAGRPSEDPWQFHVFAGYRFLRNRCEVSRGVLNLTDEDSRLNPLNPYEELVRERTFMVRCRLNF